MVDFVSGKAQFSNAIVIGASVAGLIVGAVLSRYFNSVKLVDYDEITEDTLPRKATPQCMHVHALLKSGESVLSGLFPGFKEDLKNSGGHEFKVRSQWRMYGPKGWIDPIDIGLTMLSQTRPHLEFLLRQKALALPNVEKVRARVERLLTDETRTVVGIELRGENGVEELKADLVVDASGRGGKTENWLDQAGVTLPPVEILYPEVRYTSAFFSRSTSAGPNFGGWLMFATPPNTQGAVALPVEDDRWLVTAIDRFGGKVPPDHVAFMTFLRGLPDGKFVELLAGEQPVGEFSGYRIASVHFRRFDEMARYPVGYIPVGDTIATFNPIFAQGMSVAALQAQELDRALSSLKNRPNWRSTLFGNYIMNACEPARWAWILGQATDLGYPQFKGDKSEEAIDLQSTISKLNMAMRDFPELVAAYGKVIHLLSPPESLHNELNKVGL